MLHEAPLECQHDTHSPPPPYPARLCPPSTNPCFAFPSQSASVRELCSDRLFFGLGGANLSCGCSVWPSCLESPPPTPTPFLLMHTHTRMHIPSCFRGRLRPLQTHKHTHTRALPPYPLVSLRPNLSTSPPGSLAP